MAATQRRIVSNLFTNGLALTRGFNSLGRLFLPAPAFTQVFILQVLKVICFDAFSDVLILKGIAVTPRYDDSSESPRRQPDGCRWRCRWAGNRDRKHQQGAKSAGSDTRALGRLWGMFCTYPVEVVNLEGDS